MANGPMACTGSLEEILARCDTNKPSECFSLRSRREFIHCLFTPAAGSPFSRPVCVASLVELPSCQLSALQGINTQPFKWLSCSVARVKLHGTLSVSRLIYLFVCFCNNLITCKHPLIFITHASAIIIIILRQEFPCMKLHTVSGYKSKQAARIWLIGPFGFAAAEKSS